MEIVAKEACPVCRGDATIERSDHAPDPDEAEDERLGEREWWAWDSDRGKCQRCKTALVVMADGESGWLEELHDPSKLSDEQLVGELGRRLHEAGWESNGARVTSEIRRMLELD